MLASLATAGRHPYQPDIMAARLRFACTVYIFILPALTRLTGQIIIGLVSPSAG